MFWFIATAIAVLAAVFITWPLLRDRAAVRNYGLALLVLVPVAALFLYQSVGAPEGLGITGTPGQPQRTANHPGQVNQEIDAMVAGLENRLQENPADLDGWLLLGRTYKAMQRYDQAESALVRAIQLAPNDPLVMVELAEARLFTSGNPVISPEVRETLEQVLRIDPGQQKALWLLGIAAAQAGEDQRALALWGRLSAQLEPGSAMKTSLEQQMSQIRARAEPGEPAMAAATGTADAEAESATASREPEPEPEEDKAAASGETQWRGLRVTVRAPDAPESLPDTAALFVIVRNPAMPGPPLGVARMMRPAFPALAFISDANSMMENRPISEAGEVELVARLSMSGSPAAQPEDLESAPVNVDLGETGSIELVLNPD